MYKLKVATLTTGCLKLIQAFIFKHYFPNYVYFICSMIQTDILIPELNLLLNMLLLESC